MGKTERMADLVGGDSFQVMHSCKCRIDPIPSAGRTTSRRHILTSILQPSAEMAPKYVPWVIQTDDGKLHLGQTLPQAISRDRILFYDKDGKVFELRTETIDEQMPSKTSIMPDGLEKLMTVDDLRDLLAFLTRMRLTDVPKK